jgi:ABC-type transport system substrate-binding protein
VTIPQLKDIKNQAPQAICEVAVSNTGRNLITNRDAPPFDNPDLRRAMSLSLDRKAFIDILYEGQGNIGGAMLPPTEGLWGMPADVLKTLPGYGPDEQKNRAEARSIMQKLGYGPDKRLPVTVSTRDISYYRDPAVILIDQLKEVYIDGVLDTVDTTNWYPKIMRKDYTSGSISLRPASTIPTRNSTRIMCAARSATTLVTAIARSMRWSSGNRRSRTRLGANSWSGRSKGRWRRMMLGQSSFTDGSGPAGNRS